MKAIILASIVFVLTGSAFAGSNEDQAIAACNARMRKATLPMVMNNRGGIDLTYQRTSDGPKLYYGLTPRATSEILNDLFGPYRVGDYGRIHLPGLFKTRKAALEYMSNKDVLDIGCGPHYDAVRGFYEQPGYRRYHVRAIGVDLAISDPHPGYVVQGDAADLPFMDESFDVAYSSASVFMYEPTNPAYLREASRILRVGGEFFVRYIGSDELRETFEAMVAAMPELQIVDKSPMAVYRIKKIAKSPPR